MLNILVADRLPDTKIEEMGQIPGVSCDFQPDLTVDQLPDAIGPVHILCVRSTRVNAATIARAKDLRLIIRVGSGTNTIDVSSASERGIYVANCPGKNAIAVAELTMGLLVGLDRRIPHATASLREQRWEKKAFSKADGLKGKTIGIAGLGRIGQAVARRAKAFELNVMAYDLWLTPEEANKQKIQHCNDLNELCKACDIVTVHLPYTPETEHLFNRERFALMKEGTIFLNTSRGELHDQEALLEAMDSKGLRVGLDVFNNEPASGDKKYDHPLLQHPNFIGTPHIGASTQQAQDAVAAEAIRIIREYIENGAVPNCINLQQHTPDQTQLIVRHYNKVGVLASVMEKLRAQEINIEGMSNIIFKEGKAAVATMELSRRPPDSVIAELEALEDKILSVSLTNSSD